MPKPDRPKPDREDPEREEREEDGEEEEQRLTATLAGVAFVLLLLVAGVFLAHKLSEMARVQDCVMSGRSNCAPIEVPNAN